MTLQEVAEFGEIDEKGVLRVKGWEISVAYFWTGYVPQNYPSQDSYAGRLLIEKSAAIKCPTVDL